jgi:hypothetical protein
MYNGDPHNVSAREVLGRYRENPKSATLRMGRELADVGGTRRRFWGFRSRWIRFFDRRNLTADAIVSNGIAKTYSIAARSA